MPMTHVGKGLFYENQPAIVQLAQQTAAPAVFLKLALLAYFEPPNDGLTREQLAELVYGEAGALVRGIVQAQVDGRFAHTPRDALAPYLTAAMQQAQAHIDAVLEQTHNAHKDAHTALVANLTYFQDLTTTIHAHLNQHQGNGRNLLERSELAQSILVQGASGDVTITANYLAADLTGLAEQVREELNPRLQPIRRGIRFTAVVLFLLALGLSGAAALAVNVGHEAGVICWPWLAPSQMPKGQPSVLVMGFRAVDSADVDMSTKDADDINDLIVREIAQVDGAEVRAGTGCHVARTHGKPTDQNWFAQAENQARLHDADIVVFGSVRNLGTVNNPSRAVSFEPEIYLAPAYAATETELVEGDFFTDAFRDPIARDTQQVQFAPYAELLRALIIGLDHMANSRYRLAERTFLNGRQAFIEYSLDPDTPDLTDAEGTGLEIMLIWAGNAAGREQRCDDTFAYATQALATKPNYARGLVARGGSMFRCAARDYRTYVAETQSAPFINRNYTPPNDLTCLTEPTMLIQPLLYHAQVCYDEAEAQLTPDNDTADLSIKIPSERLALLEWHVLHGYAGDWQAVATAAEDVLTRYQAADPKQQERLVMRGGRAYMTLGRASGRLACGSTTLDELQRYANQALESYQMAIALLATHSEVVYHRDFVQAISAEITNVQRILTIDQIVDEMPTPSAPDQANAANIPDGDPALCRLLQ